MNVMNTVIIVDIFAPTLMGALYALVEMAICWIVMEEPVQVGTLQYV